ncbi:predicted protein [Nematostella vectensis]|uniref:WD repeat-containing protein 93 n=1 Tax=Nematostella vectensis TaxID=45351 RepID=A7RSH1_NEMVE|nr:WD repeat-containing protein 93 [Nematostella vectensis]EDO45562.1 predicted protein [Nematostella vectensis]|eukprot:XP_001637625.1 predicted protein [Nematostella vectensis]
MPARKQKRTSLSYSEGSDDENIDDGFVTDPEKIFDVLPQPFRLVDKTVNHIFDKAWEIIEDIENNRALRRSKESLPNFDCGKALHNFANPSCMFSVDGGKYLFLAYCDGLVVIEALIGQSVATFEDPGCRKVTHMSACVLQEGFYLLTTRDEDGVAKLYCFIGETIHLARVFNEDGDKNATSVELSPDGGYIAIGWEIPDEESSLEVYKIPRESWLKEAEAAVAAPKSRKPTVVGESAESGGQSVDKPSQEDEDPKEEGNPAASPPGSRPGSGQGAAVSSFTKPSAVLRIFPPAQVGPCSATNYVAALKAVDADNSVIGTGSNHILLQQYFQHSDMTFKALHEQQLQHLKEENSPQMRKPTTHFLKPGKLIPAGLDSTPNKTNSVAVCWSKETQLSIYSLVKTAKDIEHKPDVVWPSAQPILVSTVSDCLSLLALGLENGTVVVWDVHRGLLLRVCNVSNYSQITMVHFLPSSTIPPFSDDQPSYLSSPVPVANLAIACEDGMFSVLQCGVAYNPPLRPIVDRSAIEKEVITSIKTLNKTPQIIAAIKGSGRMTLYDIQTLSSICHVSLPSPYVIDTESPSCIAADGQVIVLKGSCREEAGDDDGDDEEEKTTSMVFTFPLHSFPSLNKYWRMAKETEPFGVDSTIHTRFNSLIQDRISSQGTRQIRMQERWSRFKDELKTMHSTKTRADKTVWFTAKQTLSTRG